MAPPALALCGDRLEIAAEPNAAPRDALPLDWPSTRASLAPSAGAAFLPRGAHSLAPGCLTLHVAAAQSTTEERLDLA